MIQVASRCRRATTMLNPVDSLLAVPFGTNRRLHRPLPLTMESPEAPVLHREIRLEQTSPTGSSFTSAVRPWLAFLMTRW